jgi:hypothetical protein
MRGMFAPCVGSASAKQNGGGAGADWPGSFCQVGIGALLPPMFYHLGFTGSSRLFW